jgi:hypothetical protein
MFSNRTVVTIPPVSWATCQFYMKSFHNLKYTQTRKESYTTINTKPSSNEYILNQPTTITTNNMHQGSNLRFSRQ